MSQNDLVISNQTFPSTRADINNALQALGSLNSGATEPATKYANMMWYDTANNTLKMRSEANSYWISIGYLDQTADAFRIFDDTQVVNTSGTQTGLLGDQTTATWQAGTSTTQSLVSPANVMAAIQALGSNVTLTEFTSSGAYTKPAGANFIYVVAVGGGGCGTAWASTTTNQISSSGGQGGAVSSAYYSASNVTATVPIIVGAGAPSVTASGNIGGVYGTQGGTSSFGAILSAVGGASETSIGYPAAVQSESFFGLGPINGGVGASDGSSADQFGACGGAGVRNLTLNVTYAGGVSTGGFGSGGFSRHTTTGGQSAGGGVGAGGGGGAIFHRGTGSATSGAGAGGVVRVYSW